MRLAIVVAVTAAVLLAFATAGPADAKMPPMTIAGDDLPYEITATWPDTAGFWNAPRMPARIDNPPSKLGPGYEVVSWMWQRALPHNDLPVNDIGTYYPDCSWYLRLCDAGVVRATRGDDTFWLLLDPQRDAILRRYVELGRDALIPRTPAPIEVLASAVAHRGERIEVDINGSLLVPGSASYIAFWEHAKSMIGESRMMTYPRSVRSDEGIRLAFRLPEGRTVTERYLRSLGCFCPEPTGNGPGPSVRLRGVPAPAGLMAFLSDVAPRPEPPPPPRVPGSTGDAPSVPFWAIAAAAALGTALVGGAAARAGTLRRSSA